MKAGEIQLFYFNAFQTFSNIWSIQTKKSFSGLFFEF